MNLSASIMPEKYVLPFIKMQALGNDYIFIDGQKLLDSASRPLLSQWKAIAPALARQLCSRRFSIGADSLILAMPLAVPELKQLAIDWYGDIAKDCHLSWNYHNSDGSVSDMCGNGLRCLALWAKTENNMTAELKVATKFGIVFLNYTDNNNITATLNEPKLAADEIPFAGNIKDKKSVVQESFKIDGRQFPITCVNVGNPHCVIFEADFLKSDFYSSFGKKTEQDFFPAELAPIARAIEIDKHFPEQTNVEFVRILDRNNIQILVWERGCGPTMACGSGAIASAIAGMLEGKLDKKVNVALPGGNLLIDWSDENKIKMTGEANLTFRGQIEVNAKELRARRETNSMKAVAV